MAEEEKANDADVIARINRLEVQIAENNRLRTRFRNYSIGGSLVILLLLGVFVWRLVNYGMNYDSEKLAKSITAEARPVLEAESQILLRQIQSKMLVNKFLDQLKAEIQVQQPEFEKAGDELLAKVKDLVRERLEERLLEAMIASIEQSGDDVKSIFPDLDERVLADQLRGSTAYFVDQLHDAILERLARVQASLEGLKSSADTVGQDEIATMTGNKQTQAQEALLDALLDLVVYEIKPQLGNEIVPNTGGVQ